MGHGVPPIPPFIGPRLTRAEARDARVRTAREIADERDERERREREAAIMRNTGRIGFVEIAFAIVVAAIAVGLWARFAS